jgi:hypothetical protein
MRQSRSSRHGLELISTATPCSPQAFKNFFQINIVAGPLQQLPSGHVPQDSDEGVPHSPQDALGLRVLIHPKLAVHACDDEIEAVQSR